MSNVTINELPSAATIDGVQDLLPIYTASATATQSINRNTLLGLSSAPVGLSDSQTLTNKTLTSPMISGPTLSGTLSGTYTIGGTPTFPSSVVTLTGTQTLSNKTLTSPTINSPTITNATISADTVSGYTTSNSGTIYGMSVATGVLSSAAIAGAVNTAAIQANAVTTAKLASASVTPTQLSTGAATATVATTQTTTSTSFTDLSTAGPAVTVTIGSNGLALVIVSAQFSNSGGANSSMGFALSGANTVAANGTQCLQAQLNTTYDGMSWCGLLTGLAAGSTTFTAKYSVASGTGTWLSRYITVIPL